MILATTFYGAMFAGVFSNQIDIANNYAGSTFMHKYVLCNMKGFGIWYPLFYFRGPHGFEQYVRNCPRVSHTLNSWSNNQWKSMDI